MKRGRDTEESSYEEDEEDDDDDDEEYESDEDDSDCSISVHVERPQRARRRTEFYNDDDYDDEEEGDSAEDISSSIDDTPEAYYEMHLALRAYDEDGMEGFIGTRYGRDIMEQVTNPTNQDFITELFMMDHEHTTIHHGGFGEAICSLCNHVRKECDLMINLGGEMHYFGDLCSWQAEGTVALSDTIQSHATLRDDATRQRKISKWLVRIRNAVAQKAAAFKV